MTNTFVIRCANPVSEQTVAASTEAEAYRLVCEALAAHIDDSRDRAGYDLVLERRYMTETLVGGRERTVFLATEPKNFWSLLASTLATDTVDFNSPEDWAEIDAEIAADA